MSKSSLLLSFKKEVFFLVAGASLLVLAGCGGDEAPPDEAYAPLHYEYLRQLRLNVGSIEVRDHSQPMGPQDVSAQDPAPPGQVFAQMARDRLFAAGTSGRAVFVVDEADITQGPEGVLNGVLAGHLQILNDAGQQVAFAEARVSRQHVSGSEPENLRNNLYDMTRQMMDDMNVELEYQIRRSMRSWLVTNTAVPAPVTAEPLAPVGPAPAVVTTPEPSNPANPPPEMPQDQSAPMQMSPPPGYLQPPTSPPAPQPAPQDYPPPAYSQPGYPQPSYQQPAYPQSGYPPSGYPQPGYPQPAYPSPDDQQ